MISPTLENTLHAAFAAARARRQEFIAVEDLLLHLLDDQDAKKVLAACGADIGRLRLSLNALIATSAVVPGKGEVDTAPTLGFQRVIQRAIMHVNSISGRQDKQVTGANLLVALYGEKDSKAHELLLRQNISRLDVVNYIAHGIGKIDNGTTAEEDLRKAAKTLLNSRSLVSGADETMRQDQTNGMRLFISYSHADSDCLSRLLVHLKPLERAGLIDCWSDKKIRVGDQWKNQLQQNLDSAVVAILLLSADFLASDFITKNELPPLLMKAEAEGIRILPLILKPCGFHRDKVLQNFQALNDPKRPLLSLDTIEQESLYDQMAEEIHREIEAKRNRDSHRP